MKNTSLASAFISLSFLCTIGAISLKAETLVSADDPRIQYSGRVDFSNPKEPRFDWPDVSISVHFKGQGLGFLFQDSKNNFDVQVDGKTATVWVTKPEQSLYTITGLSDGEHTLKVVKRTEALWGLTTFKGLTLDDSTTLLNPVPLPQRRIEVLGDSWVCGYGDEGQTLQCPDLRPYENADKSFGAMVSRDLQAEVHLAAYSGRGVVRNYGEKSQISDEPYPKLFGRTLEMDPNSRWDFKKWTPDAVIIHLGLNDFTTEPKPEGTNFIAGYVALLKNVRAAYPDASIFCFTVTGWPGFGPLVQETVKQRNETGDQKVWFVGYPNLEKAELGCDWHPQVAAHRKLADILKPVLKEKLDWH